MATHRHMMTKQRLGEDRREVGRPMSTFEGGAGGSLQIGARKNQFYETLQIQETAGNGERKWGNGWHDGSGQWTKINRY
jgi:hypothetical protein